MRHTPCLDSPALEHDRVLEALALLSATAEELETVWQLTRESAEERAREIAGDSFVDEYLGLNRRR